jgi:hypothetical protein
MKAHSSTAVGQQAHSWQLSFRPPTTLLDIYTLLAMHPIDDNSVSLQSSIIFLLFYLFVRKLNPFLIPLLLLIGFSLLIVTIFTEWIST